MADNLDHPGIELVIPDKVDHYEEFVEAHRVAARLLPRLTDIVRTSAGDTGLKVEINSDGFGPCTDGSTVHLPLDPGFAKIDPNNPCVCDTEPETCLYHITVGLLLHEAAHISEGSTKPNDDDFFAQLNVNLESMIESGIFPEEFIADFCRDHADKGCRYVAEAIGSEYQVKSALEVASWFNPDAPLMTNAFEDARINLRVGDKRSALGQQMKRLVAGLVERAVSGDGITEGPLGYQVGVAVEVELEHGFDLKPALKSEAVLACLNDKAVRRMLTEFPLETVADSVICGIMLTEYGRKKYGLFDYEEKRREEGEDPPLGAGRAAANTLKSGKDLDADGKVKESQRLRDNKELGHAGDSAIGRANRTSEAEEEGRKKYTDRRTGRTDPQDEPGMSEIASAMNEARSGEVAESTEQVMQLPGGSGTFIESGEGSYSSMILRPNFEVNPEDPSGCIVRLLDDYKYPAGGGFSRASQLEVAVQPPVMASQRELADALGMNRRSASVPNLVRGRLHGSKLARVPTGNRRAFRRIEKPRKRSYAVLIGVDQSGSTGGETSSYLRNLAYAQATLLSRLGIPFAVAGHTGSNYDLEQTYCVEAGIGAKLMAETGRLRGSYATIQLVKNFAEPWDEAARSGVAAFHASHQNLDGLTMRTYIDMLCTQRATDRILLYYTDGEMPAEDRTNQRVILEAQCRRAKAMAELPDHRLHVVGVGVGTDSPKQYGLDTIRVDEDDAESGVRKVVEGLAERIAKSIRG